MSEELEPMIKSFTRKVRSMTLDLSEGSIPLLTWQTLMREGLGQFSVAAWCLGANREEFDRTATQALLDYLSFQLLHLDNFSAEIQSQAEWDLGWSSRAESYAESIKVPYWNGRTHLLPLPAMPAQGTQCMNNCGCSWRIEVINAELGDYDCYWELGKDDSCQTCVTRASNWAPYKIRGGQHYSGDI